MEKKRFSNNKKLIFGDVFESFNGNVTNRAKTYSDSSLRSSTNVSLGDLHLKAA